MKYIRFFTFVCILVFCIIASCKKGPELHLSSHEIEFEALPVDPDSISITSNVSWKVVINQTEEWITVKPMEGTNDGMIYISAQANPEFETRTAQIDIIGEGVSTYTVLVKQDAGYDIAGYIKDSKFKEYCISRFDTNEDGMIDLREASRADEIRVDRSDITSLEGIEYFAKITLLDCSFNKIEKLDLSKNLKLEELNCSSNGIESLDLTNNKELVKLFCTFNPISQFDITGLTKLKNAELFYLELESIDISTNTALSLIYLNGNKISKLDLSNNLNLNNLYCSNMLLSNLDVSNNEKLWTLECAENNLSSLNLNANKELIYLICSSNNLSDPNIVKNNNVLVKFICNENRFSSLDLSNNVKLSALECNNNQIANLNLSNNIKMTEFKCSSNKLNGSIDISNIDPEEEIKVDLTDNPDLRTIYVKNQVFIDNANYNPEYYKKDNTSEDKLGAEWVVK